MGAGCDCYYFEGIIDEVKISFVQDGEWEPASYWTFWEGEGADTGDALNNGTLQRVGSINGADWVLPDGSVVAQAMELTNDEYIFIEDISEGDTLLFYADIDEYTLYLDVSFRRDGQTMITMMMMITMTTQLRSIPMLDLTTFLRHGITIKNCQNPTMAQPMKLGLGLMQMLFGSLLLQMQT